MTTGAKREQRYQSIVLVLAFLQGFFSLCLFSWGLSGVLVSCWSPPVESWLILILGAAFAIGGAVALVYSGRDFIRCLKAMTAGSNP